MTFYEAAGGLRYTGLANRYQGFVDLSDLLKTNRAVLVAEAPAGTPQPRFHGANVALRRPAGCRPARPAHARFTFRAPGEQTQDE